MMWYLSDNGGWFGVIATARSTLGKFIHVPGVPVLATHPKSGERGI